MMTDSQRPETTRKNKLFESSIDVRWSDMDAMGHVNNAMYFRYFEIVRMAWYDSLGNSALGSEDKGMVIVDAHCEYLIPIMYPASVRITMYGASPGRSTFNSFYEITKAETDELYTRGSARIVWVDTQLNKSTPLPDSVVSALPT